jgi:pre-mRNA-processing factor 39
MWKEYLEFEIERGDIKRILILFERCLIACALYEEYWIKYARFLLGRKERTPEIVERIQDVFTRACTVHHPTKPWINLYWASFEESRSNVDNAAEILDKLSTETPDSLIIHSRRINLERRRGNIQKCLELYRKYIEELKTKNKVNAAHLSIKYALFLQKVCLLSCC